MKRLSSASFRSAPALVGCGLIFGSVAFGQSSASLSGRATDAAGRPLASAVVRLVSDTTMHPGARPWRYTLIGDSLGKFSQEGIAPGAYLVMLFTDGKAATILQSVSLKPGDAPVLEFSVGSRPQRSRSLGRTGRYRWSGGRAVWCKPGDPCSYSLGANGSAVAELAQLVGGFQSRPEELWCAPGRGVLRAAAIRRA